VLLATTTCALPRSREVERHTVGDRAEAPGVRVDVAAAADSAYGRCLRRANGTLRAYDEVEPQVAVHPGVPSTLLAAWMVQGAARSHPMRTAVSLDGGRTWGRQAIVPFGPCGWTDPDFPLSSDPWVAVDAAGRMYVAAVVLRSAGDRPVTAGIAVSVSRDTGRTWDAAQLPIAERTPRYFNDNAAITAHPRIPGTAYVLTTRYEPSDPSRPDTAEMSRAARVAPAVISITRDGGRHWTAPVAITARQRGAWAGAPQLTVDARTGALWVVYTTRVRDTLRVELVRSTDDARTWSPPIPVVTYHPLRDNTVYPGGEREVGVATDIVHLAIDTTRRQLWVAFTDGRHSDGRIAQVSLTGSADDGRRWSAPVRVDGDPQVASWRPTIATRPGGVVVAYLTPDLHRPRAAASDSLTLPMRIEARGVTLESSGVASLRRLQLLDRFDWRPTRTNEHFLGDYFGMASGSRPVLVYSRSTADGARVHARRFDPP
jgi:hypothetical protein